MRLLVLRTSSDRSRTTQSPSTTLIWRSSFLSTTFIMCSRIRRIGMFASFLSSTSSVSQRSLRFMSLLVDRLTGSRASLLREHRTKATLTGGLTIRLKRPPRTPSLSPTPSLADSIQSSTEVEVERQSPCPPPRLERRSSSTTAALTLKRLRSPCVIPTPKRIRQCSPELGGTLYTTAPSPKQEPQRSRSPMVFPSPKHGWLEDQVRRTMRKQLRRVSHRGWEAYQ